MLKVYITGPESTGKTSMSKSLAMHYSCPWVPEYARQYLSEREGVYGLDDLVEISKGQQEWNASFESSGPSILFLDTGQEVLHIWSQYKYGQVDEQIKEGLRSQAGALHILCKPDLPWESDPLREHPMERDALFEMYESLLQYYQLEYMILEGEGGERVDRAVHLVEKFKNRQDLR